MPVSARYALMAACALMIAVASSTGVTAQIMIAPHLLNRMMAPNSQAPGPHAPAAPAHETLTYGPDKAQALDLYLPRATDLPAPLVLFVHGGGWTRGSRDIATGAWKAPHYTGLGYAFATIDYRLVPHARVEDQAADVATALKRVLSDAMRLGIDRHRVVLMGHSAGAHLVALVATDETYLKAAGLSFADIAGVIPIDGAAYNVPEQMKTSGAFMNTRYEEAFGTDAARQKSLSPTLRARTPGTPRFLLLHVQRPDGIAQARELAGALRAAGTAVEVKSFPGVGLAGHVAINHRLGDPSYSATQAVDEWLKTVFGK